MRIGGLTSVGVISGDISGQAGSALDLNITGQTQGDALFFNGTSWVRLAAATAGRVLTTQGVGVNPSFDLIPLPIDLNITGQQQGSVLYFNGANWVHLPPGTSGEFLQTQGSGADPLWAVAGGDGLSNVIHSWRGYDDAVQETNTGKGMVDIVGTSPTGFDTQNSYMTARTEVARGYVPWYPPFKWRKISTINTLEAHIRSWTSGSSFNMRLLAGGLQVDSSGIGSTSPTNQSPISLNVSSIADGTLMDIELRVRTSDNQKRNINVSMFVLLGS